MLLEMEKVSKEFSGTYALRDVSFGLRPGEIHGLVGENGAGKSTLIKLLTGVYRLREGRILWDGEPVSIHSPEDSRRLGIHVIHQDRTLIPTFDGIENAYLGEPYPTRLGRIDWAAMEARVRAVMESLGISLDLKKTAAQLTPPQRTELEFVRAMMGTCRLLILDEPTASLTDQEAGRLFPLLRALRERGTAILYVTHRLEEIFLLTDRVTVLRNGVRVETFSTAQVTREELIASMTDNAPLQTARRSGGFGPVLLEAKGVSSADGVVKRGDLALRSGEILGLFGLGGSGRTELLECLFGARPMAGGQVLLEGKEYAHPSPHASLRRGMALVPEDRRGKAMAGELTVRENVTLSSIDAFSRRGVIQNKKESAAVAGQIGDLQIKVTSPRQRMTELSGGNQQKVIFARVLLTCPKVLLCDEPTQAVDVATRGEIHRLLRQKADEGAAVLFVSSDLKELLEVADTVQIMSRGRTLERQANTDLTQRQVLARCYGETEGREEL